MNHGVSRLAGSFLVLLLASWSPAGFPAAACGDHGAWLQVLGSGGPEADDGRASTGYLLWQDGRARVLVDLGTGSLLHFEQAGARVNDLDAILLSHLHVDHASDIEALVKASYFTGRDRNLSLYGPTGNDLMPPVSEFVQSLLGPRGAYRYLADYLDGSADYRLVAHDVIAGGTAQAGVVPAADLSATAVPVHHGPIPALAWRVELGGKAVVFSGDMSGSKQTLGPLAAGADLLVAHNAIPEGAQGAARALHMPPSVIGDIAARAEVKQLVLSHRMSRSLGREDQTLAIIRRLYDGPVHFADDLQCFRP